MLDGALFRFHLVFTELFNILYIPCYGLWSTQIKPLYIINVSINSFVLFCVKWLLTMAGSHPAMPSCFSHQAKVENHVYVSLSLFLRCYPLRFATQNCRSLASKIKLEQLGLDVNSYSVDIMALQETTMVGGPTLSRYLTLTLCCAPLTEG